MDEQERTEKLVHDIVWSIKFIMTMCFGGIVGVALNMIIDAAAG